MDGIGTCWPRSAAGELISRPCPEQFNGIHYNTTSKYLSVYLSICLLCDLVLLIEYWWWTHGGVAKPFVLHILIIYSGVYFQEITEREINRDKTSVNPGEFDA